MKSIFLTAILVMSTAHASDACGIYFDNGNSQASKGAQYAQKASSLFNQMKERAEEGAPSSELCQLGTDSRMSAYLSAVSFRKARVAWLDAINLCQAPNDATAAEQADLNTEYYNTQAEFIADMDNLLGARCGSKPLTPLLNN